MNVVFTDNDRLFQVWQKTFIAFPYQFKILDSCCELGIYHIEETTHLSEQITMYFFQIYKQQLR